MCARCRLLIEGGPQSIGLLLLAASIPAYSPGSLRVVTDSVCGRRAGLFEAIAPGIDAKLPPRPRTPRRHGRAAGAALAARGLTVPRRARHGMILAIRLGSTIWHHGVQHRCCFSPITGAATVESRRCAGHPGDDPDACHSGHRSVWITIAISLLHSGAALSVGCFGVVQQGAHSVCIRFLNEASAQKLSIISIILTRMCLILGKLTCRIFPAVTARTNHAFMTNSKY